jgi:mevalonate kinase
MPISTYPAKVLLLGEYTILNGSKALALPYKNFSGKWSYEVNDSEARASSQKSLRSFLDHSAEEYIDLKQLRSDLDKGLWFDSTIPQGYGLGSSGALIAAIHQSYALLHGNLQEERLSLAHLEDHFHGSSSGLDPLVSHIQKPLLIHSFDQVETLESPLNLKGFFLLNTGKPRQTGPLVSIYQDKLKDPEFKKGCANVLAKEVNFAIEGLSKGDTSNLFHHLWLISKFQWDFFPEMIPTQMRGIWTKGLESGDFVLKLCGAGGGGFLLGYSEKYDLSGMQKLIDSHELSYLS